MKLWNINLFQNGVGKDVFRNEKLIDLYLKDIDLWRSYLYSNIWFFLNNINVQIDADDYHENKWEIMLYLDYKILCQLEKIKDKVIDQKICNQIIKYLKISLRWYLFNKKIRNIEHVSIEDIQDIACTEESPNIDYDVDIFVSNVIYEMWLSDKDIKICIMIKMKTPKKTVMNMLKITEKHYDRIFNKFKIALKRACIE